MVDCQPANLPLSFETPVWGYERQHHSLNPFDSMPQTPPRRGEQRISSILSKRVLANLDSLSAPNFVEGQGPPRKRLSFTPSASSAPLFQAALQRMQKGGALERLKQERDYANLRTSEVLAEAEERIQALSASQHQSTTTMEKPPSSSVVKLGRGVQRRNSGMARSAWETNITNREKNRFCLFVVVVATTRDLF
jgi:hypothetical protein